MAGDWVSQCEELVVRSKAKQVSPKVSQDHQEISLAASLECALSR